MQLTEPDPFDTAIVASLPVLIKARPQEHGGRRILEVEASCEAVDYDGDVVLQEALIGSAASFIATGHLDIDHLSEFGERLGLPNPSSYIVGRPLEVKALPNRRTFVLCEISKSIDGSVDVMRHRYDEFWMSLQREPPVRWFSSVYGFPTDLIDCTTGTCDGAGARRFVIKAMDWRSLAFTRTPKCEALESPARIITAKSRFLELAKSMNSPANKKQGTSDLRIVPVALPETMTDVWNDGACPKCAVHKAPSLLGYRLHMEKCRGYTQGQADILAHALMHRHAMQRAITL